METPSSPISPSDAPPSYNASVAGPSAHQLAEASTQGGEDSPPPFSTSPITLSISSTSYLIQPSPANTNSNEFMPRYTRALYELTHPLDGHAHEVGIVEIYPKRRLDSQGRIKNLVPKDIQYKISEKHNYFPFSRHTAINGVGKRSIRGTVLKKTITLGLATIWEAKSYSEDWFGRNTPLYHAQARDEPTMEWKDAKGEVVAIDTWPADHEGEEWNLEILVPLEKKMLDMMVAVWVARIFQETEKNGRVEEFQRREQGE